MNKETMRNCDELYKEYQVKKQVISTSRIHFELGENDHRDIYNITAPFLWKGETLIAGRVEARDSEYSETIFFEEVSGRWIKKEEYPVLKLQDPFITKLKDEIVVGGVEVYDDPKGNGGLAYRTVFYKGNDIKNLKLFTKGPERMKDIRLLQLKDGNILVFTRPQGKIGGRGKIAFTHIANINQLGVESIEKAEVLEGQFYEEEWGGANELHLLSNGKVGVLAHIAKFDEKGNRYYYSSSFCFDSKTGEYTPMKMIAARGDFEKGESKRPDLQEVIFSGGIIRSGNGYAKLYCGVGDAEGHVIEIQDPFLEYEV